VFGIVKEEGHNIGKEWVFIMETGASYQLIDLSAASTITMLNIHATIGA
jgi:hypothetical protein